MDLKGKNVLFLGSSVTYGSASGGVSFADIMAGICEFNCIKEAVSGTTLADIGNRSYVSRLKCIDPELKADLFICQLSTNDATKGIAIEETEKAIRDIVCHVEHTYGCRIIFFTSTYFNSPAYEEMISLLYKIRDDYGFSVLDLYNDAEMRSVLDEKIKRYMRDPIHPTLVGYEEWWTPKFIDFCKNLA